MISVIDVVLSRDVGDTCVRERMSRENRGHVVDKALPKGITVCHRPTSFTIAAM